MIAAVTGVQFRFPSSRNYFHPTIVFMLSLTVLGMSLLLLIMSLYLFK
jgi:hypothetical protein